MLASILLLLKSKVNDIPEAAKWLHEASEGKYFLNGCLPGWLRGADPKTGMRSFVLYTAKPWLHRSQTRAKGELLLKKRLLSEGSKTERDLIAISPYVDTLESKESCWRLL